MLRYMVIQERTNLDGSKSVITDKFSKIVDAREFALKHFNDNIMIGIQPINEPTLSLEITEEILSKPQPW